MELLQYTVSMPQGSGQLTFCISPPHGLGALGSATLGLHYLTARGQWALELTLAIHCLTVWGQWVV